MSMTFARNVLQVFRNDWDERLWRFEQSEDPDADGQLRFVDEPLVNEMCLILLVAVWHQVERELIDAAALLAFNGQEISFDQYRNQLRNKRWQFLKRREQFLAELGVESFPEWHSSMTTLRLLANCYKHDPALEADGNLLGHLGLDGKLTYGCLPESDDIREKLAQSVGLEWSDTSYIAIVEAFIGKAEGFLASVRARPGFSRIKPEPISLDPDDCAR
jgi:hypothetical protein